jgi:hypothetical protein
LELPERKIAAVAAAAAKHPESPIQEVDATESPR